MTTQESLLVISSDRIAAAIMILFSLLVGPRATAIGMAVLRGFRPHPKTWAYRRALTQINLLNAIRGVPFQPLIYEWQWTIFGWYNIIVGLSLVLVGIPVFMFFLVRR